MVAHTCHHRMLHIVRTYPASSRAPTEARTVPLSRLRPNPGQYLHARKQANPPVLPEAAPRPQFSKERS
eukprot:1176760-Prymnesium_polylepis.1